MAKLPKYRDFAVFAGDTLIEDALPTYTQAKQAANEYAINLLPKNRVYGKVNVRNSNGEKLYETDYIDLKGE